MTQKCDNLKTLARLETVIEKQYAGAGYVNYKFMMDAIASLKHELQIEHDTAVNELKKDLGVYYND